MSCVYIIFIMIIFISSGDFSTQFLRQSYASPGKELELLEQARDEYFGI